MNRNAGLTSIAAIRQAMTIFLLLTAGLSQIAVGQAATAQQKKDWMIQRIALF